MPFIPHTSEDVAEMLATIQVASIDDLFAEIPSELKIKKLTGLLPKLTEMELARLMRMTAARDATELCFVGAGAYEHHIPAAVWEIASRGEFLTAYTPYQAEASQGTLQLLYEFQTMMCNLLKLDASNASLYEGGSALAEAVLMAVRLSKTTRDKHRILMPSVVHPLYRQAVQTIVGQLPIEIVEIPFDPVSGRCNIEQLNLDTSQEFDALIIPQPNFFGHLEEVDRLTDWAHAHKALVIAVVNPMAMALLKPPGEWGEQGADIACGEGQPLGVPLAAGGPYYGFICCKKAYVRQMPGRIAGRTTDRAGRTGYVLTLQAREQHIRRAKATSNICTNQGLLVTASTIYMALLGPQGLYNVALQSHENAVLLREKLLAVKGVTEVFHTPIFHEFVIRLAHPVAEVLAELATYRIQGGLNLKTYYPELGECLLVCATETKTAADLTLFAEQLAAALARLHSATTPKTAHSLG